jgi:hypothetical protein
MIATSYVDHIRLQIEGIADLARDAAVRGELDEREIEAVRQAFLDAATDVEGAAACREAELDMLDQRAMEASFDVPFEEIFEPTIGRAAWAPPFSTSTPRRASSAGLCPMDRSFARVLAIALATAR